MTTVVFVTVQFEQTNSGPGTFADYIFRQYRNAPSVRLLVVTEDVENPNLYGGSVCKVHLPKSKILRTRPFRGRYYRDTIAKVESTLEGAIVWHNTSPLISFYDLSRQPRRNPRVAMISDDNNVSARLWNHLASPRVTDGVKKWFLRHMERRALRQADSVVTNSRYLRETTSRAYGLDPDRVEVLYKGVDLSFFRFRDPREVVMSSSPLKVLFAKRDYLRGGLSTVLAGLARLDLPSVLTVAGPDTSHDETIERIARKTGFSGTLRMQGRLSKQELAQAYRENDILCLLSEKEALGVVLLEAMSSGLPVIGTPVGGILEVLDHGRAGWLVSPGDASALAITIENILNHVDQRIEKVLAGRQRSAQFSVDTMYRRFEAILIKVSDEFSTQ